MENLTNTGPEPSESMAEGVDADLSAARADLNAADALLKGVDTSASGALSLRGITKEFSGQGQSRVVAVASVDLDIAPGEFITLLGPSGCGKTTTLRMIAGFEDPTAGEVVLDGENLISSPPNNRPMAMVFQSYALFPHLRVRDNVAYGLKVRRLPAKQIQEEVDLALTSMNLMGLHTRAPNQLSGGQQQRVALARAMVMKPKVLLFDEPLSNLDAKLREQMRLEIRRLQRRLGITSVYVTHDQSEAMSMSDRIVVMNAGRVEQAAPPDVIYRRPASVFVADFIGRANFLDVANVSHSQGQSTLDVLGQRVTVPAHPDAATASDVVLLVRPESVRLSPDNANGEVLGAGGRVLSSVFFGDHVEYEIETESGTITAVVADPNVSDIFPEGASVQVTFNTERAWLLPR